METNIYAYLTPLAIFFVLLEVGINWYYDKGLIRFQEFIANFGTAVGNQTMNVLVMAGVYWGYGFLWENYRFMTIELNVVNFILLLCHHNISIKNKLFGIVSINSLRIINRLSYVIVTFYKVEVKFGG